MHIRVYFRQYLFLIEVVKRSEIFHNFGKTFP